MQNSNKRITIAGNIIVDTVKTVDKYPEKLSLATIRDVNQTLGGLLTNVARVLAILDPQLPIQAIGHVGDDAGAEFALQKLHEHPNIDTTNVHREKNMRTAFTDVINEKDTGERTFFTYNGADALLTVDDFDSEQLGDILHVGYILLLPGLDAPDPEYGTKLARLLARVREAGTETSVDIVSEDGGKYQEKMYPALPYTDYLTINETEAERTTGVQLRSAGGTLLEENMPAALQRLREAGVRKWITIHAPEGAFGLNENNRFVQAPSENFPPGYIRSSVGAGDAFAAGLLLSALHGEPLSTALEMANTVAGMSLRGWGGADGIGTWEEAKQHLAARKEAEDGPH